MKLKNIFALISLCGILTCAFYACSSSNDTPTDDPNAVVTLSVNANKVQEVTTTLKLGTHASYLWHMESAPDSLFVLQDSTSARALFAAITPGVYHITLNATDNGQHYIRSYQVSVSAAPTVCSPYIAEVYDFNPAPGQFINEIPAYVKGNSKADMIAACRKALVGKEKGDLISLGGFGGAVVFGFDHTVLNIKGRRDFRVLGNAFFAAANPKPNAPRGGSCEPGIVMVAYDKNHNSKPDDDEWYEIAGSEYANSKTIHDYQITYSRPTTETHDPDGDGELASIVKYIYWTDNQGHSGYKIKNIYHDQSYYPGWITDAKLLFDGTLLPDNAIDEGSESAHYWVQYCYGYGYVDNVPNNDIDSAIDIDWAVDKNGNKVHLPGIDFVKVYCAMNQECGWLGETSTEVMGAVDLHTAGINLPTNGK